MHVLIRYVNNSAYQSHYNQVLVKIDVMQLNWGIETIANETR
jgi:hypothetical protein